jgi:hypothetical protein
MKKNIFSSIIGLLWFVPGLLAQTVAATPHELVFVSDTQQPMRVEMVVLKPDHNLQATASIFSEIIKRKPNNLFMLGDVVSLGFKNKKWHNVDRFLDSCRNEGVNVNALLGNHELLEHPVKGERNFDKRFPGSVRTGYVSVADSIAVVLLNSNFSSLTAQEMALQQSWYQNTLDSLDKTDSIVSVVVACHHAPFTNSKIVGSSAKVQRNFVPAYIKSKKAQLFITGHAHAFEHFRQQGKDFVVIGGGGGLHQPLDSSVVALPDLARNYKPNYHFLSVNRINNILFIHSHYLNKNFIGFETGHSFEINLAETAQPDKGAFQSN